MGGKANQLGIAQEIKIWYMHKQKSDLENKSQKILWGFEI